VTFTVNRQPVTGDEIMKRMATWTSAISILEGESALRYTGSPTRIRMDSTGLFTRARGFTHDRWPAMNAGP
jgi:hypothetical protein